MEKILYNKASSVEYRLLFLVKLSVDNCHSLNPVFGQNVTLQLLLLFGSVRAVGALDRDGVLGVFGVDVLPHVSAIQAMVRAVKALEDLLPQLHRRPPVPLLLYAAQELWRK